MFVSLQLKSHVYRILWVVAERSNIEKSRSDEINRSLSLRKGALFLTFLDAWKRRKLLCMLTDTTSTTAYVMVAPMEASLLA